MEWLEQFREEISNVRPLVCALATTADGRPCVRSVICRGVEDDGALLITSDARSRKNRQLRAVPVAETCFWLAEQRVQWRLFGSCTIENQGERHTRAWWELNDSARALFVWPASGEPRADDAAFANALAADTVPPAMFELLVVRPTEVDRLDLNPTPHTRRIWKGPHWKGIDVNP